MRIVHPDENTLVLRPTDSLIFVLLGILIACASPFLVMVNTSESGPQWEGVLVGGIIGIAFILCAAPERFTQWKFDRLEGTLTYRRLTLAGMKEDRYALRDIAEARVTQEPIRRRMTGFGAELITHDGQTIPIVKWKDTNREGKARLVAAIQEFLQRQQPA